jgi:hypothetical protein
VDRGWWHHIDKPDAKQTQSRITHAIKTRNCAQNLRWTPKQRTSSQKKVDRYAKQRQDDR